MRGIAAISVVIFHFMEIAVPEIIGAQAFPALAGYSARAERTPAFIAAPPL